MSRSQLNTLLWLDLPARDLDRAKNFYQQVLELMAHDHRPDQPSISFYIDPAGSGLTLLQSETVSSGMATPYLSCEGRLQQATAWARLNGGQVISELEAMQPFGYRSLLLDSEGNRIALHSSTAQDITASGV